MNKHPLQNVRTDEQRVTRFVCNEAVRYLLDKGGIDMNALWVAYHKGHFGEADLQQFYQLIGYSLDGYSEIEWSNRDSITAADEMAASGCDGQTAKIRSLQTSLSALRNGLRGPIADLYGIHEDDLGR